MSKIGFIRGRLLIKSVYIQRNIKYPSPSKIGFKKTVRKSRVKLCALNCNLLYSQKKLVVVDFC